jgi:hypothetical protein
MTFLERVVARYPDGRTVTFEDGEVTGDPGLIADLEAQTGSCGLTPEGPFYDAAEFAVSGNAFIAATQNLHRGVHFECEGTEPINPGVTPTPALGSDDAKAQAEYERELAEWRERRLA